MEKHPLHTRLPELQKSEEVEKAVQKKKRVTGEKTPNDPSARIDTYLDRLENLINPPPLEGHENFDRKERNIELLKTKLHENFIIKSEQFPASYFELQQRVARERGQPVENISSEMRDRMIAAVIADQESSLDRWVQYLTSDDAMYPTWFKYFVFRNVLKLSQFDKELGKFKTRTESTTAPFPDIYYEPLAKICDIYEKATQDKSLLNDPEVKAALSKKFPSLYAELIRKSLEVQIEGKETVEGEWVKYEQGDTARADELAESVTGTGWCTAGEATAEMQIKSGAFYVFKSNDKNGIPKHPRIAIRMEGDHIGEIRGILPHQELEPIMADTLEKKLSEFGPEADAYKKKPADMKRLTSIDQKTQENQPLTREDLTFLYEIDSKIEGFGYDRDPRIAELLKNRNPKEDAPTVLDCQPTEIAWGPQEITETTKAYIGPWSVDTFNKLPAGVTHLYESFPDRKIFLKSFETDPTITTPEIAGKALSAKGYKIGGHTKDMLAKTEFSGKKESYTLVRFSVKELGFPQGAATAEIIGTEDDVDQGGNPAPFTSGRMTKLGLELVPAEGGVQLRLQYPDQPQGEYLRMAMKQISDRDGTPNVWHVLARVGGRWLGHVYARPSNRWSGDGRFVFRTRKF